VKTHQTSSYPQARADFLRVLKEQPGVERDGTFESFFTMPEPDQTKVLVGLTRWRSAAGFATASGKLMPMAEPQAVFSKVDMRAFVQVRTADGEVFRLEDQIYGPDQVLEIGAAASPRPASALHPIAISSVASGCAEGASTGGLDAPDALDLLSPIAVTANRGAISTSRAVPETGRG
jgi:hypothetical protein